MNRKPPAISQPSDASDHYTSITIQLIVAILPLILIFMAFSFFFVLRHEADILKKENEKRAATLSKSLAVLSSEATRSLNSYLLQQYTEQFAQIEGIRNVTVYNTSHKIIADSDTHDIGKTLEDPLANFEQPAESTIFVYKEQEKPPILESYSPVLIQGKQTATVKMSLSLEDRDNALDYSQRQLIALTLILLAGSIVFIGLIAHWFTKPLLKLTNIAREVANGNFNARSHAKPTDEIGLLGSSINHMARQLEFMFSQEKKVRKRLQERVQNLFEFTKSVRQGNLNQRAETGEPDTMGHLTQAVNEMVADIKHRFDEERAMRSQLQRAHDQLKELDQMKSEFLNTVSHELRTPLTSIKAFAEILLDNAGEDIETQQEFLTIINNESDRLTRLINNLLDLSRLEAGKMRWHEEESDLQEIVTCAHQALRGSAEKKGVHFRLEADFSMPLYADRDKLIQVCTNIAGNALKFTPTGGTITIHAEPVDSNRALITISDTGCGIPLDHQQSIFEKFSQVDTSETRDIKGTGLGLPIAKSIIERHGGRIWVESEPSVGATFYIELPLPKEPSKRSDTDTPASQHILQSPQVQEIVKQGHNLGRSVFIVDDEPNIRRLLRHILQEVEIEVHESSSIKDAYPSIVEHLPNLILLDLVLEDGSGLELLKKLKNTEQTKDIPVVILSILREEESMTTSDISDYLTKPIDRRLLLKRITSIMDKHDHKQGHILVVDDDPSIRRAVQALLQDKGFLVQTAEHGREALDKIYLEAPLAIVLDLMMPVMTGHEVLRKLHLNPKTRDIPVIILSAADDSQMEIAQQLGAKHLLQKPIHRQKLTGILGEYLPEAFTKLEQKREPLENSEPKDNPREVQDESKP